MLQIAGPLDLEVVLVRVVQPIAPQAVEGMRHFTVENVPARMNEAREYLAPRHPRVHDAPHRAPGASRQGGVTVITTDLLSVEQTVLEHSD